jgi:cytochrome c oxidase assembly protein subunit 11
VTHPVPLDPAVRRRATRTALGCVAFAGFMLGAAYAAAPLYDLFCRVTGFGGTPLRAASAPATPGTRTMTVRFDANVNGLPWRFAPEVGSIKVRTDDTQTVFYQLKNTSDRPVTGIASFNVDPPVASPYFVKIQCFCYTDTTLQPGESLAVPVVFYLDKDLETDRDLSRVSAITLSYTFFPAKTPAKPVADAARPPS